MRNTGPYQGKRYKGVSFRNGKWRTYIEHGGRQTHLGYFDSEVEAAATYDAAARAMFGQYARFNLPSPVAA